MNNKNKNKKDKKIIFEVLQQLDDQDLSIREAIKMNQKRRTELINDIISGHFNLD
jgi:hypothetical protein